jgi:hypothetical protein
MAGYGLFSAGQQNAKALLTGRYVHIFEGVIFQSDMRRKFSNRLRVFKFGHFSFTPIPTCASGSSLVRESQIPRNHLDGHADSSAIAPSSVPTLRRSLILVARKP